jgi:ribosomal-protein-alanine N-acetyltransferase
VSEPADGNAFDRATLAPARPEDIESLVAIDRGSPRPWAHAAFEHELENAPPTLFTLHHQGRPVGFVVRRIQPPEMDIVNLAVAEEHRQLGFGARLLRLLLERARLEGVRQVFLEVRESNRRARDLYRRFGFAETQRRKNFYKDPVEDALLMSLKIEP